MPIDYPAHFFRERRWRVERRPPDPERIREAVALLAEAQRPVIIAGGGVHYSEAWRELQDFAEALGIPVGETFAGKGAMKDASPMALGGHRPGGDGHRRRDHRRGRPGDLRRHPADRLRHRVAVVLPPSRRSGSSASTCAATTPTSRVRCRSSPTPAMALRALRQAALAAGLQAARRPTATRSPPPAAPGTRRCERGLRTATKARR